MADVAMPVGYPAAVGGCSNLSMENGPCCGDAAVAGNGCGLQGKLAVELVAAPGNKLAGYPAGVE